MQFYRRNFIRSVLVVLVLGSLLHQPVVLASEQPEASILKGMEAYEAGEFQKALEFFAEAVSLGSTKISLYYNIGVAHYRLAQYEEADAAFIKVAQSPEWASLALYNRALIAHRKNQPERAKKLASESISQSKSPGLTAQNYRLIEVINKNGQKKSAWSEWILASVGHNDNVLLTDADASAISGKGDAYVAVIGRAKRAFALEDSGKLSFIVDASVLDFAKLNEYDQLGLRGGVEKELGRPDRTLGAYLEHVALAGLSYKLISSLEYQRDFSSEWIGPVGFRYRFDHYNMLNSNYAHLGGLRHRIRLAREKKLAKNSSELYMSAEYNDREDQKVMANFYSFSPVRFGVGAIYTKNLDHQRTYSGSLYFRQSLFMDPDKRGGVFKTRQDGFLEFRLRLTKLSSSNWLYRGNYIHAFNNSNYPEFSYSQNIVSFEILKAF